MYVIAITCTCFGTSVKRLGLVRILALPVYKFGLLIIIINLHSMVAPHGCLIIF